MIGNRKKLGELLVAAGVLDETRLQAALSEQRKWGGKLGRTLIDLGFVREEIMVKALSHQLQLPTVDFTRDLPTAEAISRVPVQTAERYGIFPMAYDDAKKTLSVATSDPTSDSTLRDLRLELGLRTVSPVVAGAHDIDRAIRRYYYGQRTEATPTATPSHFGLSEQLIDLGVPSAGIIPGQELAPTASTEHVDLLSNQTRPTSSSPARPKSQGVSKLPPPLPPSANPGGAQPPPTLKAPSSVFTAAAMVSAPRGVPAGTEINEQLLASVQRLEMLLSAEVRSLRVLVELLVEKGLVDRDDYLKRVKDRDR
jgi:type IV pilus assembly protein PilB